MDDKQQEMVRTEIKNEHKKLQTKTKNKYDKGRDKKIKGNMSYKRIRDKVKKQYEYRNKKWSNKEEELNKQI